MRKKAFLWNFIIALGAVINIIIIILIILFVIRS